MIWNYVTVLAWVITIYSVIGAVRDVISWKTSRKSKEIAGSTEEDCGTVWDDLKERFWVLVFSVSWLIVYYCL